MESILLPPVIYKKCCNCEKIGYYVTCYVCYNCPICKCDTYWDSEIEDNLDVLDIAYCDTCKIPFQKGCTHGDNGCTCDVYHAMFITKFTFDGVTYTGMPKFETREDCCLNIEKLDCEWYCTCDGQSYDCNKAYYPKEVKKCYFKS